MNINWKVRIKNKHFWVSIIPVVLVLVARILALFGITFDSESISGQLVEIVEILFVGLGIIGVVNDPTTEGLSDSSRAMTYELPRADQAMVQNVNPVVVEPEPEPEATEKVVEEENEESEEEEVVEEEKPKKKTTKKKSTTTSKKKKDSNE